MRFEGETVPVVRYFEGRDGIKELIQDVFISSDDKKLRIMYPYKLLHELFF